MIYNPQTKNLKELEDSRNLWIKSKIKFQWDFKESLEKLVWKLENSIRKNIISNYWIEYTSYWNQIIKIKIKDKVLIIDKLISCTLFYNKNDKIYWYVTPIFTSSEKWQKPKKYELSKFSLSDDNIIVKGIVNKIIDIIEEF